MCIVGKKICRNSRKMWCNNFLPIFFKRRKYLLLNKIFPGNFFVFPVNLSEMSKIYSISSFKQEFSRKIFSFSGRFVQKVKNKVGPIRKCAKPTFPKENIWKFSATYEIAVKEKFGAAG